MPVPHYVPTERDNELLSAYLDGALTPGDRQALERRLQADGDLRAELDALRSTTHLLRRLPTLKAPRNFTLDPALYARRPAWWGRLFAPGFALQLSGAVGTLAAIVLIVAFVTASPQRETRRSDREAPSASVALAPTTTLLPTATAASLTEDEATAIAYSGEGLFQATLAMQSTVYAGTPESEWAADQASGVFAQSAPTETPSAAPALGAVGSAAEADAAPQDELPAQEEAQALSAPAAAPFAALAPSPTAPENMFMGGANAGQASQEQPEVADGVTTQSDQAQKDVIASETPTPLPTATPPAAREASVQSDKSTPENGRPWGLAALAGLALAASIVAFAAGRRLARRA